jgi:peptidoglycan/xylan/chitin deacetylase (PgdA/CDA1 family)
MKVSWSWDDGRLDERIIEVFLSHGITSISFFPTSWPFKNYRVLRRYAPFEVGNHTFSHHNLTTRSSSEIAADVMKWQHVLEDELQRPIVGLAYPFGGFNAAVIDSVRSLGFLYARTHLTPCFDGFHVNPTTTFGAWDFWDRYYESRLRGDCFVIADHAPDVDPKALDSALKIMTSNGDRFVSHVGLVRDCDAFFESA